MTSSSSFQLKLFCDNQSRRLMECLNENFLTQLIGKPTRRGALLDLVLKTKELIGTFKVKGSLGYSDHEMVKFRMLRRRTRTKSQFSTLDFRKVD